MDIERQIDLGTEDKYLDEYQSLLKRSGRKLIKKKTDKILIMYANKVIFLRRNDLNTLYNPLIPSVNSSILTKLPPSLFFFSKSKGNL